MATNTSWSIFARNIQGVWTVALLPPYMYLYTLLWLLRAKLFDFYRSRIECGATALFGRTTVRCKASTYKGLKQSDIHICYCVELSGLAWNAVSHHWKPRNIKMFSINIFFFFRWHYSPLWALGCRTIHLHFSLSITNSLHLLTPSTWRSLSTSSLHPFLGLPLRLIPSSSWVKIFLCILSSSILSRWPSQLILCPFIHFTIFSSNTEINNLFGACNPTILNFFFKTMR